VPGCRASVADSGSSSTGSSPKSTQSGLSSKTSQLFVLADWNKCSGRSLRSGMMRNGIVYPLPPLVHLTKGTGYGLSATPTALMPPEREQPLSRTRVLKSGRPRKLSKNGKDGSMNWCQEILHNGIVLLRRSSANFG
jgi:hypothetical protein